MPRHQLTPEFIRVSAQIDQIVAAIRSGKTKDIADARKFLHTLADNASPALLEATLAAMGDWMAKG